VSALEGALSGEAVLLQASCHNPTGVPLSSGQWREIATIVERRGLLPLIDLAYQGLGKGLEEDVAGLRILVERVPETLIAVSCSKSFALYRERTGAVYATSDSVPAIDIIRSNLCSIARTSYSMPPDHGAAVVRTILSNDRLRGMWAGELDTMRARISELRSALAAGLGGRWPALRAIENQEGMFAILPLAEPDIFRLRTEFGIYMPMSGRINITGLTVDRCAEAIDRFVMVKGST
jgi:aromatic-amino-acid transaminase